MEKFNLLTITGAYWFFHPIGTGTIFTYHTKARQILITCSATGELINVVDLYNEGGFKTPEDFKKEASRVYLEMISEDNVSMDLSYYPNPTYIGNSMVEVDFDILKN